MSFSQFLFSSHQKFPILIFLFSFSYYWIIILPSVPTKTDSKMLFYFLAGLIVNSYSETNACNAQENKWGSAIDEARALKVPKDTKIVDGMDEHWDWWEDHESLLYDAWQEFGIGDKDLEDFKLEFLHPVLRKAIMNVR